MQADAADSPAPPESSHEAAARRAREADALRENLARRKAQGRARSAQSLADQAKPSEDHVKCR